MCTCTNTHIDTGTYTHTIPVNFLFLDENVRWFHLEYPDESLFGESNKNCVEQEEHQQVLLRRTGETRRTQGTKAG